MNDLKLEIDQATLRDGLLDLVAGAFLLAVGGIFLLEPKLVPFIAVLFLPGKPLFEKLKERYVHPRAGYVKLVDDSEKDTRGIGVTAALATAGLAVSLVVLLVLKGAHEGRELFMRWVFPATASLLFAMGPLYLGRKYGLKRGYINAMLIAASGAAITATGLVTGYRAVGALCLQAGVFFMITGGVLFVRFLTLNPVAEDEDE